MGKRRQISSTSKKNKPHHHQQAAKNAKPTGITKPQPSKRKPQASQSKPIIPFEKHESILLIGEADLSFTISLLLHHHCTNLTATVLEASESELIAKYPQAASNIQTITQGGGVIKFGVDVQKKGCVKRAVGGGGKKYERVFFNFPHVGGKSTDVNRQVRYNQELLVSFFTATKPLLADKKGSSILVTLFEGEPYSLWNIRDLGRHCGLEVKRSWKFQREVWRGYRHARTLGAVRGKDGKEGGGWKGEERAARSFEFVRRGEGVVQGGGKGKGGESSDDEDQVGVDEDINKDIEDESGLDLDDVPTDAEMNEDPNDPSPDESQTAEESWEGIESDSTPDDSNQDDDDD